MLWNTKCLINCLIVTKLYFSRWNAILPWRSEAGPLFPVNSGKCQQLRGKPGSRTGEKGEAGSCGVSWGFKERRSLGKALWENMWGRKLRKEQGAWLRVAWGAAAQGRERKSLEVNPGDAARAQPLFPRAALRVPEGLFRFPPLGSTLLFPEWVGNSVLCYLPKVQWSCLSGEVRNLVGLQGRPGLTFIQPLHFLPVESGVTDPCASVSTTPQHPLQKSVVRIRYSFFQN